MQQHGPGPVPETGPPSAPSASSIIRVCVYTSPSGCHWGGCPQSTIAYTSGMMCFMSPVSTSISTPALLRGASSILSSSSRMRSGAIRAQQAGVPANGSVRFRFHGHFPGDGKADRPHQAQGIFLKAAVRIPDRPQNSRLNVRHAIHIIHDAAREGRKKVLQTGRSS